MPVETKRLCLRPVVASDADALFRIYGDPATNTFNPSGPYPDLHHAETVLKRWIHHREQHGFGNWAISLLDTPTSIIGFGGLSILSYDGITINNLGYRFATEAWGKGLATEFAEGTLKYGFNALKLPEIAAVVRGNHLASQKVLEKSGLKYIREIHDVKNAPPSLLYSISQQAWLNEQRLLC
ncbi:MAG: GNAT family N-acetyltransferase [Enterobacter asburiae]|nr:GNAT family N-acetyltransferase [Enterobacter asburiae]